MGVIKKQSQLIWQLVGSLSLLFILFLPWRFQVNDDELMMWLVSGAYTGTPESYAVFIHPILSWFFSVLYKLVPHLPWYPIVWFSILWFSYLVFVGQVFEKCKEGWLASCWSLIILAFLVHFTFFLQFSMVAAFAVSSGLLARLIQWQKVNSSFWRIYPTDFLILLGFLVRPEVALLLTGSLFIFCLIFRQKFSFWNQWLIPGLILGLGYFVSWIWINGIGMDVFVSVNHLRSQVFDSPILQLNKDFWKTVNPDLYYFANGLQDFSEHKLNADQLNQWNVELQNKRWGMISGTFFLKAIWNDIQDEHFLIGIGLIMVFFSLVIQFRLGLLSLALIFLGFIILSPFYLIKVQIFGLGILFFLIIQLIYLDSSKKDFAGFSRGFTAVLILGIIFHFRSFFKSYDNLPNKDLLNQVISNIGSSSDQEIYLVVDNKYYLNEVFQNPLPFKILGWGSLLEQYQKSGSHFDKKVFLIDENTFWANQGYFDESRISIEELENLLLIQFQ